MTTDRAIHRTGVQARAAANAREDFGGFAAANITAPVVEQDDVEFLGTIAVLRTTRPSDQCGIDRHFLTGGGSCQHLQALLEIRHGRHQFLDAHQRDVNARQRRDHSTVAFVGHETQRAGFNHAEIDAADAQVGPEKVLSQFSARDRREFLGIVGIRDL
jgi:hypothetical protein